MSVRQALALGIGGILLFSIATITFAEGPSSDQIAADLQTGTGANPGVQPLVVTNTPTMTQTATTTRTLTTTHTPTQLPTPANPTGAGLYAASNDQTTTYYLPLVRTDTNASTG